MIVKLHKTKNNQLILAVCDKDIIGKKFEEEKKQLDMTSDFYKGEEMSDKKTADLMKKAYMINFVGKEAIKLAINESIIEKENTKKICNVPYAMVLVDKN